MDDPTDHLDRSSMSECCDAPMMTGGICSDCKEHAEAQAPDLEMRFPDIYRWRDPHPLYVSKFGDRFGVFLLPHGGDRLMCIACDADPARPDASPGWEHVSVTVRNKRGVPLSRCPTWEQMAFVKAQFWPPAVCVVQFHPPESEYVNNHPFCLHLWRPINLTIPTPPSIMVGVKGLQLPTQ